MRLIGTDHDHVEVEVEVEVRHDLPFADAKEAMLRAIMKIDHPGDHVNVRTWSGTDRPSAEADP